VTIPYVLFAHLMDFPDLRYQDSGFSR
jgi:hypothetical protein